MTGTNLVSARSSGWGTACRVRAVLCPVARAQPVRPESCAFAKHKRFERSLLHKRDSSMCERNHNPSFPPPPKFATFTHENG